MTAPSDLEQGRQSFARHAWKDAFTRLSAVDNASPLEPEDIERLGISAYLIGNESDSLEMLARAHREWLKRDHTERAAQSAFWLGFVLLQKGQRAQGNGWIARSKRLLDEAREGGPGPHEGSRVGLAVGDLPIERGAQDAVADLQRRAHRDGLLQERVL